MADKLPEVKPMKELLANIDRDMERSFAPPMRKQERTPEEQTRVASLTGEVLRKAAQDASAAVIKSVEETEAKVATLRKLAEEEMARLDAWTDDFAQQQRELLERCHALEASITETVQHIIAIGQKPLGSNSKGE
jgi:propanediol dehydratase large subunit